MPQEKNDTFESCKHENPWLRWLLLGGALVAWAMWRRWQRHLEKQAYPSPVREPVHAPEADKPPAEREPELEPEPVEEAAEPDDLTRIEGIGPKVAQVLADAGIKTFAQLAEAEIESLREILREAGLQFMNPTTWPEQAALAAKDAWADLTALQTDLKGGQRA